MEFCRTPGMHNELGYINGEKLLEFKFIESTYYVSLIILVQLSLCYHQPNNYSNEGLMASNDFYPIPRQKICWLFLFSS